jgi:hypothetical protein
MMLLVLSFVACKKDNGGSSSNPETNITASFTDITFRAYCIAAFDAAGNGNNDGKIQLKEVYTVTKLNVAGQNIQSLAGIENFAALKELQCQNNKLTALDVSKNKVLTLLHCPDNQLTTLNVSANTLLEDLVCNNNQLTALDVTKCTGLINLGFEKNKIAAIDLTKNTALTYLYCANNKLAALDLTKNTALQYLDCMMNQLTTLDVSKNTALISILCGNNKITALDVSKNEALQVLVCPYNQLTTLDAGKKKALQVLDCSYNKLTSLNTNAANYNEILTNLDLNCAGNQLGTLNFSMTGLKRLDCSDNQLNFLDLHVNIGLIYVNCKGNPFSSKVIYVWFINKPNTVTFLVDAGITLQFQV